LALGALLAPAACAPSESAGPRIGEPAPAYAAANLEGDTLSLASFRGDVVLLNLWATWCGPCREETPYLQSVYEDRADDGLVILGISLDAGDTGPQVASFVEEYGVTYPILHDPAMRGLQLYRVLGLPASFLIDRDGVLRWMRYGPIDESSADFQAALEDALR
jgi:cytochrome c-type biogenesis protein